LVAHHTRVRRRGRSRRKWVQEGGGVRLRGSIGGGSLDALDPALLFGHIGSDEPRDCLAGFPLHLHGGSETVVHTPAGEVGHRDMLSTVGSAESCGLQTGTPVRP
jgi:redox-sensitive bicupin YhaK (pirin superfamily)